MEIRMRNPGLTVHILYTAPISLTILVNFILFISIIQILIQKVYSSDSRGSEYRQYLRLAKSTLLLIPLFGVNYIVFVFVPDHLNVYFRLVFDLALGSFQVGNHDTFR
ncbi:hypothetical protein scyTo_0014811 [Scyliorhinus torazame]|uniref:G-protein coupled receptors family 2 profile 2 domain-containing protein n=1 Tax=Scyliorhinus torazame TaxID=75743 RepID=A0A401NV67_SCYTO|nr:hypothetical protein [Scyliorhinus torazame]